MNKAPFLALCLAVVGSGVLLSQDASSPVQGILASAAPAASGKPTPSTTGSVLFPADKSFVHPGLLQTASDLDFVRSKIKSGQQPWAAAWDAFCKDRTGWTQASYRAVPVADVVQGPYGNPDVGGAQMMQDASAAYGNALRWCLEGDKANADAAIAILNAWSSTLRTLTGPNNQSKVLAGWTACKFANAAELLLRGTAPDGSKSGWADADVEKCRAMFETILYPLIKEFQPTFNGNWDTTMINSMICMGVFLDDREKFNRAVDYYLHGSGNGALTHYIYDSGQCQETTRDQAHTQMGIGAMASVCRIAEVQGLDLWSAENNRLALGYEFTAAWNLGVNLPTKGVPGSGRGKFTPIYEMAYQHYVVEQGLDMPYLKQVVAKMRPEKASNIILEGWGTLVGFRGEP